MTDDINKKDENELDNKPSTEDEASLTADSNKADAAKGKKDEDIDLDKEIENLDEFLMESEEDDDLSLEDEEHVLTASSFKRQEKKNYAGKYVGYFVFVVLLCGLLYGGVVYGPQLFENPELEAFEKSMANRMNELEQTETSTGEVAQNESTNDIAVAGVEADSIPSAPSDEDMNGVEPLPQAADEELATMDETDATNVETVEDTEEVAEAEPATTIADALALTQSEGEQEMPTAQTQEVVIEEIDADNTENSAIDEEADVDTADVEAPANNNRTGAVDIFGDGFERTPATSLAESRDQASAEDNLPPLEDEQIEIANDVMQMPEEEITEVVEAADQVAEETDNIADKNNITIGAEQAMKEEAIEETIEAGVESETSVEAEELTENVVTETEEMVEDAAAEDSVVEEEEVTEIEISIPDQPLEENQPVETSEVNELDMSAEEQVVIETIEVIEPEDSVEDPETVAKSTAKPVSSPVATTSKPAPSKPADPRVAQAQKAYSQGNYAQALNLYTSVLADDPANTSALTGRQLTRAKLRLNPTEGTGATDTASTFRASTTPAAAPEMSTYQDNTAVMAANSSVFKGTAVTTTPEAVELRQRLRQGAASAQVSPSSETNELSSSALSGVSGMRADDTVLMPEPVPADVVAEPSSPDVFEMKTNDEGVIVEEITAGSDPMPMSRTPVQSDMPVMDVESNPIVVAPSPQNDIEMTTTVPDQPIAAPQQATELNDMDRMIAEANADPRNVTLAVAIGDKFEEQGDNANAREWYKKALKYDAMYKLGLNRMSVYDRLAGVR